MLLNQNSLPWLAQDAVFKRLSEIAEVASLTKEERDLYDESLRHYRDTAKATGLSTDEISKL